MFFKRDLHLSELSVLNRKVRTKCSTRKFSYENNETLSQKQRLKENK